MTPRLPALAARITAPFISAKNVITDSVKSGLQKASAAFDEIFIRTAKLVTTVVLKVLLRPKLRGLENLKDIKNERMVIVANHSSLLDGIVLAALLPVRPAFAIATDQYEKFARFPGARFLMDRVPLLPIDPSKPQAIKTLTRMAQSGRPVMIFPEGRLTPTGTMMQIFDGAAAVAEAADAKILPIYIKNLNHLPMGTYGLRHHPRTPFPDVSVTVLPARKLDTADSGTTKERRQVRLKSLQSIMHQMPVEAIDPRRTLIQDLHKTVRHFGRKRITLEDAQYNKFTYGKVLSAAHALGAALAKRTTEKENVGLMLPSTPAAAISFWALQAEARVPAMLNFSADAPTLVSCANTASLKTVVTARAFVELAKLEDKIKALEEAGMKIIYLEDLKKEIGTFAKLKALVQARGLGRKPAGLDSKKADGSHPAVILFTSGSEGVPKGVVLSHNNIRSNIEQVDVLSPIGPGDKVFNALPAFHAFGLGGGIIMPMLLGIPSCQFPSPLESKVIPKAIYMSDATVMFATDTFLRLYAKGTDSDADMARLRLVFAGAEALTAETAQTYIDRFGVKIYEGYGMTEASPVVAINVPGANTPGTVGKLLPGMEQRLLPVEDMPDAYRLQIRGPNIMVGYLYAEQPGVIVPPADGWHDTGDIVRLADNGALKLAGRAKRFAKIGGEMVSLDAIEALARAASPQAEQAAVLKQESGKPDEIVLFTTDAALKREQLAAAAKEAARSTLGLPGNDNIRLLADIPKLATGKTDYVTLKGMLADFNQAAARVPETVATPAATPAAVSTAAGKGPKNK